MDTPHPLHVLAPDWRLFVQAGFLTPDPQHPTTRGMIRVQDAPEPVPCARCHAGRCYACTT